MNNFSDDKLDKMLKAYCTRENEAFVYKKPKKIKHTALIAACLVLVILAGVIFIPNLFPHKEHSFIIVANAKSLDKSGLASADEITADAFVELENVCGNLVYFDFDEVLCENAEPYDLTKNFVFHNFVTNLNINVAGDDIKTVTYKVHGGAFSPLHASLNTKGPSDGPDFIETVNHVITFSYERALTEYTYEYDKDMLVQLSFNPVYSEGATYESVGRFFSSPYEYARAHSGYNCTESYVYSENSDELKEKYGWASLIGSGYRSSSPSVVTEEEKAKLKEFAENDDMVGFFNFQNQIFKRLIDGTTIDVTVTTHNGASETKTLELMYTPKEVTTSEWYTDNPNNCYSNGNISAKLK